MRGPVAAHVSPAVIGSAAPLAAAPAPDYRADGTRSGIAMEQVGKGIYRFSASFDGYVENTSSTAIVGRDGVLVFDTNTRPATAAAVLARIRTLTDRPVRWVVNSHWHLDHWSGNQVYADAFPGLAIVATEGTDSYMRAAAPAWPAMFASRAARLRAEGGASEPAHAAADEFAAAMASIRRTFPTRTYRGQLTLDIGGRTVVLREITGDASHATMLWLPAERVLMTGDALVGPVSWTAQGYAMSPWIDSLHAMAALAPAAIVPGHGPLMRDTAYLELFTAYMEDTRARVRDAVRAGALTPEQVREAIGPSAYRERFVAGDAARAEEFDYYYGSLIRKLFLEQRDGMEAR